MAHSGGGEDPARWGMQRLRPQAATTPCIRARVRAPGHEAPWIVPSGWRELVPPAPSAQAVARFGRGCRSGLTLPVSRREHRGAGPQGLHLPGAAGSCRGLSPAGVFPPGPWGRSLDSDQGGLGAHTEKQHGVGEPDGWRQGLESTWRGQPGRGVEQHRAQWAGKGARGQAPLPARAGNPAQLGWEPAFFWRGLETLVGRVSPAPGARGPGCSPSIHWPRIGTLSGEAKGC